ncbi:hypothetical protein M0811_10930 [Anaeramoeba ignava]|uniref:DUF445 domain-containing protein n=1 Tax=Anaeramoeba ignava TaxID=1746090 RepID=A0A9Q0LCZ6_ANAIG|nr:hypothetical protein M0811_10930 [Anaeramoeba ignava]
MKNFGKQHFEKFDEVELQDSNELQKEPNQEEIEIELELEEPNQIERNRKQESKEINNNDFQVSQDKLLLPKNQQTFYQKWIRPRFNKGFLSNLTSFTIFLIGLIIRASSQTHTNSNKAGRYILSMGLFGFAGGITNWLAIKMLFDKIPFLYGSGIIPRRFREIRETVKNTIMKTFFDEKYLKKYISTQLKKYIGSMHIEEKFMKALESPKISGLIESKLGTLKDRPEGFVLTNLGIDPTSLKPLVLPFVIGIGKDIIPIFISYADSAQWFDIEKIRIELDLLMTEKLKQLTPQIVKQLMEDIMRDHLGWLIVWGNVFGALIGLISSIAGYG